MAELKTKRGRLTAAGLACGYVEQKSTDLNQFRSGDLYTELYADSGVYHVRQYDRRPNAEKFQVFWESFPRLKEAHTLFNKQPGLIKKRI